MLEVGRKRVDLKPRSGVWRLPRAPPLGGRHLERREAALRLGGRYRWVAAEGLCELHWRRDGLPVIVLRTSRFFPEEDDDAAMRARYPVENAQANELLYRRVEIADVVDAHLVALDKAPVLGFGRYIISATTPFGPEDLAALGQDAAAVVERLYPGCGVLYAARGWSLFPMVDRVYVNALARRELGWRPRHDFVSVLKALRADQDFRSPLAHAVGSKGYHAEIFAEGPYPVR